MTRLFKLEQPLGRRSPWMDGFILAALGALLYLGIRLSLGAPEAIQGPEISLDPASLPWYAALSIGRMSAAYALSMVFSLGYGALAARGGRMERILLPSLDMLQTVPILSFLPVVLLSLSSVFPQDTAAELSSIFLIFTSMAWNIAFAWYQSLVTIPEELKEASRVFRMGGWMTFKTLQLPFAAMSLIWNSIMSWSGGWFFLMAAEIFTLGQRDFRLPGLGSYLQEAANRGDTKAILWGLATIILVIVAIDQLVWRPILAWAERFKMSAMGTDVPQTSWFYDALLSSRIVAWINRRLLRPLHARLDGFLIGRSRPRSAAGGRAFPAWLGRAVAVVAAAGLAWGLYWAALLVLAVPTDRWLDMAVGLGATFLRVMIALAVALAWTIPVGTAIGTNPRLATVLQPIVQIVASIPATAVFPIILLFLVKLTGGLNLAAILLMLMGTQWYLLFNIIAGAAAIPQDLKYTATLMSLRGLARWRTLILPALFPYIVTGAIVAAGGAWNASIVSEYVNFNGQTLMTVGIGATIARAASEADYPVLLTATLTMVMAVVAFNHLVWQRLFRIAEEKYRLE